MGFPDKSAAVRLPVCTADATGRNGVYRIAVSTTAASYAIPVAMRNNFVRIQSVTANSQVAISTGTAGQTLVINQASALGTGHAAAGASVLAGSFIDGIMPKGATFLNVVADAAGFIELYVSEVLSPGAGFIS